MKWNYHLKGTSIQVQLKQVSLEQKKNLHCLEIVFSIEYLARQGLPLHGHGHEDERGNFTQLVKLRANDCKDLQVWMERKRAYFSHEIQSEILKIMSHQILRSILKDVSSSLVFCDG